jgi:predicted nucleic acid-binding protein
VIAYLDSSVVLRVLFGQPDALADWKRIERAVSSELIRVECLRAIDRLRVRTHLDERAIGRQRAAIIETLETIEMVTLDGPILDRASDPFPTSLGTHDAIHLATALGIREQVPSMIFATHDDELGLAASAMGFEVRGVKTAD